MALPTLITVHGKFIKPNGAPEQGVVSFKSDVYSLSSETDTIMVPGNVSGYLASDGTITLTLPATNDPEWTPAGWTYTFIAQFSQAFYTYEVVIPFDAPGGSLSITELVPASSSGNNSLYAPYNHSHAQYLTDDELEGAVQDQVTSAVNTIVPPIVADAVDEALEDSLANYATVTQLNTKAPINSPTFTGTVSGISKAMVGLANVDNTSDSAKPVSTATQTALNGKANTVHNHVVSDVSGLSATLTSIDSELDNKVNSADLAPVATSGSYNDLLDKPGPSGGAVDSVAGRTGDVVLTKSDVGLANVDNTSDVNKPVSSATQAALNAKANTSSLAAVATSGDYTDLINKPTAPVTSVAGKTGAVTLVKGDVGLANVDNTSDVNKPVSSATQTALNLKADSDDLSAVALSGSYNDLLDKPSGSGNVTSVAGRTGDVVLTKSDVGLANVDNTSDANKPISTATQDALDDKVDAADLALVATSGSYNDLADKPTIPTVPVTSVAGKTGDVTLTKSDVGLANVDNTADSAKPVSTAQQTALNLKANLASPTFTGTVSGITKAMVGLGNVDNTADTAKPVSTAQQTALDLKANLASPTFTGTVSGISKSMVGLANVDNTSDATKNSASATLANKTLSSPAFTGTPTGLTKSHVGLANVDNTSDANKPVSTATQTALNLKADSSTVTTLSGRVTAVEDMTPVVMIWNGTAYVESNTARVYVGPGEPTGTIPDGSIWIDTDA